MAEPIDPAQSPARPAASMLRCFRCNYDLSATPADANCPECGLSGPDRRSHATSEYLRQLRTGLWLIFIGIAVGLAVSLWPSLVPDTFLGWIDGIGWAERIGSMVLWALRTAASACILVGLWRFFARPPSVATNIAAARGLLNDRFRFAVRVVIAALMADWALNAVPNSLAWINNEWTISFFNWLIETAPWSLGPNQMWTIFALQAAVWLSAGFMAFRLARRLADQRLELAILIALWAVPLLRYVVPKAIDIVYVSFDAQRPYLAFTITEILSEVAIAALAFCLHRRLKSV